jgi:pimeloyl-ACP methyl ester carboxylesterase
MKTFGLIVGGLILLLVVGLVGTWLYYRAPDVPQDALVAQYGKPTSHFADLGGGMNVHYLDEGKAGAPPIVLIHGFGDNAFSWEGWVKVLGADHRVISVDLPGHGLTQAPVGFVAAPDKLADVIDQLAGKIGLPPFAVAGNSLGGGVAWQLAVRHPARVSDLILVDAGGWTPPPSNKPLPLAFRIMKYKLGRDLITSIDNTPLIREGLRGEVGNPKVITEPFIARWAMLQRAPGHRPILMTLSPGAVAASNAVLSVIKVPTLILWGAVDPLIPLDSGKKFAAAIPGSKLIVYPGVGHLPQVEIPEKTANDVKAFLAGAPSR